MLLIITFIFVVQKEKVKTKDLHWQVIEHHCCDAFIGMSFMLLIITFIIVRKPSVAGEIVLLTECYYSMFVTTNHYFV